MYTHEDLINELASQPWNNKSISEEAYNYIKTNYKQVDTEDRGGRSWFKVHRAAGDSKYGAFMICPDFNQWRNTTMKEFYGGAVVD